MAKFIVNGNQQSVNTFDGMTFSEAVRDSRWESLTGLLNVDSDATPQIKVGRVFAAVEDTDDEVTIGANTQIRFVVGGGGKGLCV
jgi:hypothetical protein